MYMIRNEIKEFVNFEDIMRDILIRWKIIER